MGKLKSSTGLPILPLLDELAKTIKRTESDHVFTSSPINSVNLAGEYLSTQSLSQHDCLSKVEQGVPSALFDDKISCSNSDIDEIYTEEHMVDSEYFDFILLDKRLDSNVCEQVNSIR